MKHLVNLIQLAVAIAIILPIIYIWQTDDVAKFCREIKPGMIQQQVLDLIDLRGMNLTEMVGDDVDGGQWYVTVKTYLPTVYYQCHIEGVSKLVVRADLIKSAPESAQAQS